MNNSESWHIRMKIVCWVPNAYDAESHSQVVNHNQMTDNRAVRWGESAPVKSFKHESHQGSPCQIVSALTNCNLVCSTQNHETIWHTAIRPVSLPQKNSSDDITSDVIGNPLNLPMQFDRTRVLRNHRVRLTPSITKVPLGPVSEPPKITSWI